MAVYSSHILRIHTVSGNVVVFFLFNHIFFCVFVLLSTCVFRDTRKKKVNKSTFDQHISLGLILGRLGKLSCFTNSTLIINFSGFVVVLVWIRETIRVSWNTVMFICNGNLLSGLHSHNIIAM